MVFIVFNLKVEDVAVKELSNEVLKSILLYYNALHQFGYKSYKDVDKLLAYIFIDDLLKGPMRVYITEKDFRIISKALYCLFGNSCLIPYPKRFEGTDLFGEVDLSISPRLTEDSSIRFTTEDAMRFKASGYTK